MKLVEFLYFYLMPENPPAKMGVTSATNTAVLGGRGREIAAAFAADRNKRRESTMLGCEKGDSDCKTRTTDEKQEMLGKYLNNVQDLVEDLKEGGGPFGAGS